MFNIMKIQKSHIICLCLCLSAVLPTVLFAQDESKIANSFTAHGEKLIKKGKIDKAINDFSRALLVEPANKDAKALLLDISSRDDLSTEQKMDLLHFEDLIKKTSSLKKKIEEYELKRNLLGQEVIESGFMSTGLEDELLKIKNETLNGLNMNIVLTDDQLLEHTEPLKAVNDSLDHDKEKLAFKLKYLIKQYNHLREVVRGNDETRSRLQLAQIKSNSKKSEIKKNNAEMDKIVKDISNDVDQTKDVDNKRFKQEMSVVQKKLGELSEIVDHKDSKVSELTKQLVSSALKLTEMDSMLTERTEEVEDLTEKMNKLYDRYEIGQKIIGEKDIRIDELETEIEVSKKDYAKREKQLEGFIENKDKSIEELTQKADKYYKELNVAKEQVETQEVEMLALNQEFDNIKTKFSKSKTLVQDKEMKILTLQSNIKKVQRPSVREKKLVKNIKIRNRRLNDLKDTLNMYRKSMGAAKESIEQKDQEIVKVNEEIMNLRESYAQKFNKESNSEKRITLLTQALKEAKEKRDVYNDNLRNLVKEKDEEIGEIKGMMQAYRSQLNDIRTETAGKDEAINNLESRLTSIQDVLYEKDDVLQNAKKSIFALETQLSDIQQKVTQLKTGESKINNAKNTKEDKEINALEFKVNKVNDYVQEEIKQLDTPQAAGIDSFDYFNRLKSN